MEMPLIWSGYQALSEQAGEQNAMNAVLQPVIVVASESRQPGSSCAACAERQLMLEHFAESDGLKHVLSALLSWVFLLIYARVD